LTRKPLPISKYIDVEKRTVDAIGKIVAQLSHNKIDRYSSLLGFDACIDHIVRIVKNKKENSDPEFFSRSSQFGEFLVNQGNRSCGVELRNQVSKIGGNMVITANALGNLGVKVNCIGTFGLPDILPVFRSMSPNCSLHTVGETISATALEFTESKVIMFDPGPYCELSWNGIKELLGIEHLKQLFTGKQLISFLNWSEIENSSLIWQGILDEMLPLLLPSESPELFFTDLSDCSRKSKKEILLALNLLGRFRKYSKVILSLNRNEAGLIAEALDLPANSSDKEFIKSLYDRTKIDIITIHQTADALAYDGFVFEKCDTFYCKEPVILTGGGDNFNAGFGFAQLLGFDLFDTLVVANAVSGYYVKNGTSPDNNQLMAFLQQNM